MSTTTGNVKISELQELPSIDNNRGNKLIIPISIDRSDTSNPDWGSYKVTASVLSGFMEHSLGLSTVKTDITNLKSSSTTQTNDLNELLKHLGKYNLLNKINYTSTLGKYISINGEEVTNSNYRISSKISLKQGCLYIVDWSGMPMEGYTSDISIISKVHEREYVDSTGATHSEITYEPLPKPGRNHFDNLNYLIFFAPEDMDVVFCAHASFNNSGVWTEVKYGAFIQIADNLLSINGEMMKVIVEAITKNRKDIESLYEKTRSLGDIHVTSIDSDEYPSVQGEPMVVVKNRAPGAETATHGADVPNRIGQIWVNTTNGIAYIAVALGLEGWKQITV